jgi:hypothetical protein
MQDIFIFFSIHLLVLISTLSPENSAFSAHGKSVDNNVKNRNKLTI